MKIVTVFDDQGKEHNINAALILDVFERPKTGPGSIIKFSNGTSLPVQEEVVTVVKQMQAGSDFESYR